MRHFNKKINNMFYHYIGKGIYWFRIFGYGLCIKNTKYFNLPFSHRHGHVKYFKIGKLVVTTLKPKKNKK